MKIKRSEVIQLANKYIGNDSLEAQNQIMLKIATARCARLSYMTFDNEIDYQKDIKLHDQLFKSKHFSPFEHCARAMSDKEYYSFVRGESVAMKGVPNRFTNKHYGWCNNFKGFIPYRYILENNI